MGSNSRLTCSNSRVTSSNSRGTSSNPRVMSSNPRVRSSNSRVRESLNQIKLKEAAFNFLLEIKKIISDVINFASKRNFKQVFV